MSIRVCAIVTLGEGGSEPLKHEVAEALHGAAKHVDAIQQSHAGVHLPGVVGAGDLTWDFLVSDAPALDSLKRVLASESSAHLAGALGDEGLAERSRCSFYGAVLEPVAASAERPQAFGVKRTNLVQVRADAPPSAVEQWCQEVPVLADHVPAIRNWSLSRVVDFVGDAPPRKWTHAWEQDFETLEGLTQDYMMSPYHWGYLDGWYDPEMPWSIIEPELAHLYCEAKQSVLCWASPSPSARGEVST